MIVYNEIDPFAAAWLRELCKQNLIAPGEVWEHDIRDIRPIDLANVIQFHAFAGIGVWSYALRRAGWPDSRPIWTGSCPCQPFSAAGAGAGFADERHLWPHFHHLIRECGPAVVIGEQVASKDADAWIDLVQADMEALDYAFGAVPFPSASVGAPHIRDRTYWLAVAERGRCEVGKSERRGSGAIVSPGVAIRLAHAAQQQRDRTWSRRARWGLEYSDSGAVGGLGHAERVDAGRHTGSSFGAQGGPCLRAVGDYSGPPGSAGRPSPTNGLWGDPDWLFCRDGKWRPVEPGTFPLAHGAAARVGRLRGYGNAINAEQARIFVEEVQEILYPAIDTDARPDVRMMDMFG